MTPYPETFPADAASVLVKKLRGGAVGLPELAAAGWNVQGYVQSMTIGRAPDALGAGQDDAEYDADGLATALETMIAGGRAALPWAMMLKALVRLVILPILMEQATA